MVIIKTKHIAPTNTRGARIKASANGFSTIIPFPYHTDDAGGVLTYFEAVKALIKKHNLDWDISKMGYGSDENGNYYFTFACSVMPL